MYYRYCRNLYLCYTDKYKKHNFVLYEKYLFSLVIDIKSFHKCKLCEHLIPVIFLFLFAISFLKELWVFVIDCPVNYMFIRWWFPVHHNDRLFSCNYQEILFYHEALNYVIFFNIKCIFKDCNNVTSPEPPDKLTF